MIVAVLILIVGSVLASGILFRHQRVLTLLAAAGAIFQTWHLFLALTRRLIWPQADSELVLLIGSLLFLALWVPFRKHWRLPYLAAGSGWRDAVVLLVLAPTLASAFLIQQANGLHDGEWIAHGFYNGDTGAFIATVQRSLLTQGLVEHNLFAANGHLEYPSVVHAGVAEYILQFGRTYDWLTFLPLIVYLQILITVPLFFLVRDMVKDVMSFREGYRWRWRGLLLEGAMAGYVLGVSWESYVYPQGHFFIMGFFMLLLALLVRLWPLSGRGQIMWGGLGYMLAVLLLLSNAVTGVAAMAAWAVFGWLRCLDRTRGGNERLAYGVSLIILLILFVIFTPGDGGLQLMPHFSYTAAPGMLLFALPLLIVLGAAVQQLRRQPFVGLTAILLTGLALVTFIFSDRNIIIDNASRFFYHALLIGWPLAVDSVVRGARLLTGRLRQLGSPHLMAAGAAAMLLVIGILLLPVGASVASVHDHLLFQNEHRSHVGIRLGMQWITENTPVDAVFLAWPYESWEVPMFTGRALVRADYWLSPHDALEQAVFDAFAGDHEAQRIAAAEVDYIVLKSEDLPRWNIPEEARVYHFGGLSIYDAKKWVGI